MYRRVCLALLLACVIVAPARAQEMPARYQTALTLLGKGDYKDGVLKINLPRNDLHVTVHGIPLPTAFGFSGWIAMTPGEAGHDVMMGDLVLTEDEVNPVMSALLTRGLEVSALHNHFFWEQPRLFYMHVHGHGDAADLATRVKPALALIGHGAWATAQPSKGQSTIDTAALDAIIGRKGDLNNGVYKYTIGRADLNLKDMGATVNARMGLNTWAAFYGTDQSAAIAGDIAMLEEEVTPVLQALRANGLDVVAIHHHMTGSRPMIIFLHYWGTGPAPRLAHGFEAALRVIGTATPGPSTTLRHPAPPK